MTRRKHQEIIRRTAAASRESAEPQLSVQADLDSSRGYTALSRATTAVIGRLGEAASGVNADRLSRRADDEQAKGQRDRTEESLQGASARSAEELRDASEPYRRGYYLTEAANRIQETKLSLAKRLAALRPGDDPQPIIQEEMGGMLSRPEFQDKAVMRQLAPALQQLQGSVLEFHQRTELAEIFESQQENLRELARADILSGELRTPEGVERFRAALNTEQFAYLSPDDADQVISEAFVRLLESGEVAPEEVTEFLKQRVGDRSALWDQGDNADRFTTAARAGAVVRQREFEERRANVLADMEPGLQDKAGRGALATSEINSIADRLEISGKERLSFVRHWINQNQTGQRRMESEAKAAARHRQLIGAITAGAALSHTDAELRKAAQTEWAAAVASGDQQKKAGVISRFTRAGVVIPQLKDLLGRTTRNNLTANYELYEALSRVDPVVADRYLSDENATLFAQHHDNITKFGMTAQESLASLPTGANKGRREEVAQTLSQAATRYFRDNPEMPDGSPRPHWFSNRVQAEATRLALAAPDASPEVNLQVAERRVMGNSIKINGQWTPRGGARPGTEPAIEDFVQRAARDAVAAGIMDKDTAKGVRAGPNPQDPNVFVVLRPDGFPMVNPKTGRAVSFDPNEIAAQRVRYEADRAEAEARHKQEHGTRPTPAGTVGFSTGPALPITGAATPGFEFPDFIDYLQSQKRQP